METSAKDGINVHKAFFQMCEEIYANMKIYMNQVNNEIDSQINDSIGKGINLMEKNSKNNTLANNTDFLPERLNLVKLMLKQVELIIIFLNIDILLQILILSESINQFESEDRRMLLDIR